MHTYIHTCAAEYAYKCVCVCVCLLIFVGWILPGLTLIEVLKLTGCSSFLTLVGCIILPVTAIDLRSFLTLGDGTHQVAVRMSPGSLSGGGKSPWVNYCSLLTVGSLRSFMLCSVRALGNAMRSSVKGYFRAQPLVQKKTWTRIPDLLLERNLWLGLSAMKIKQMTHKATFSRPMCELLCIRECEQKYKYEIFNVFLMGTWWIA